MTYEERIATPGQMESPHWPDPQPIEVTPEIEKVARLIDHLAFEAVDRNPAMADDKVSGGFYSRREYAIGLAHTFRQIFAGPGVASALNPPPTTLAELDARWAVFGGRLDPPPTLAELDAMIERMKMIRGRWASNLVYARSLDIELVALKRLRDGLPQ